MKRSFRDILPALRRRIVTSLRGGGRPVPKDVLDKEFASGSWAHFSSWEELPRYLLLAGSINHFYDAPAVLDVACGDGRLAKVFGIYPFERYVGIDISGEGLSRARALGLPRIEFREADFEKWRSDERFDAIVFGECLGYAEDPGAVVERFALNLRKGGRLFISQFRYGNWRQLWRRIGKFAAVEAATSVTNDERKTWDIKVLHPIRGAQP